MPSSFTDYTHYKFDIVFDVANGLGTVDENWWYISRNDGCQGCQIAVRSENVSGTTHGPGDTVSVGFDWLFPHLGENYSAARNGNAFGSWAQTNEIARFQSGGTPAQGAVQSEAFSFVAPVVSGIYSVRLILTSQFAHRTSFTDVPNDASDYFFDLVFSVE